MKFLLVIALLFIYVNADEMQRIESIVSDIKKLRQKYEKSQEALELALVQLKDERDKNDILLRELETRENELKNLKKQINNSKKTDKPNNNSKLISKEIKTVYLKNKIKKKNVFPKLQMRKEEQTLVKADTKAMTYRLNKNAEIYASLDGQIVENWEERTSFTSNYKLGSWIKITGYFVDKVWRKSSTELWVREEDTLQREVK